MNSNETIELNDLALTCDQQTEVKGGPISDPITYTFTVTNTSSAAATNNRGLLIVGVDDVKLQP